MTFFTSTIQGLPPTGFYAPDFVVEVGGRALDPESKGDVLSIKLTMALGEITSAEISLNNWDDKAVWFKYSDRASPYVGDPVTVKLGYAGRIIPLLFGEINSLAPVFPASGSPTLRIGVLDLMSRLRNSRPGDDAVRQFIDYQFSDVAEEIGQRHGLTVEAVPDGIVHPEILQGNADDAQFLQMLARKIGYSCYVHTDPVNGNAILRFGPPTDGALAASEVEHSCAWGESLISFEPTLTMSDQVSQVTVRGWNHDTMTEIIATATAADLPGGAGASGPENAASGSRGQDVVIAADVQTEEEATALARGLLQNRADAYITGKGEIIGTPDLRPGDNMRIADLGTRFSGSYHVTQVEHEIGAEGFRTTFEARRQRDGGSG